MSVDKSLIHLSLVPGIGPRTIQQLLQEFESADKILSLTLDDIDSGKLSVDPNLLRRIVYEKEKISVDQELELIQENDCQVVTCGDSSYPVLLRDILDPPPVLYFKGEIPPETIPYLSIVGAREPTDNAKKICYELASQSANKGMTIVSGATNGVDETAHRGAIDAQGKTVAIMACGLSQVHLCENRNLITEIMENGTVVSEFPMSAKTKVMNFVQRNRLVSGLSKDTILVESTDRSGSLITARFALEQERNVFILDGANSSSRTSLATHRLISRGARLVDSAEEVLESLPNYSVSQYQNLSVPLVDSDQFETEDQPVPNSKPKTKQSDTAITKPSQQASETPDTTSSQEKMILSAIDNGDESGIHIDQISRATGLPVHTIAGILTMMELQGRVVQLPGMNFLCQSDN